jgi:hypothetical protein
LKKTSASMPPSTPTVAMPSESAAPTAISALKIAFAVTPVAGSTSLRRSRSAGTPGSRWR